MVSYKAFIYKKVPEGFPVDGQDIAVETRELDISSPPKGGLIYKTNYVSFDPYQRVRMRPEHVKSYVPAFKPNTAITNRAIVTVVASDNARFKTGQVIVSDNLETAEYGALSEQAVKLAWPFENKYNLDPKLFLGPIGMPGLAAYSSLLEIGQPKEGETIFVSSAAGSVGTLVGQIAKRKGLRTIGSAGSDEKVDYIIKELGYDAGFNYKKETAAEALKRLAPDGIDIYYDNVGGEQLEAAINHINDFGRIVECGMISQYNLKPTKENPNPYYPIRNLMYVVTKRLTMRGFIVSDKGFGPKWALQHNQEIQQWIHEGKFKAKLQPTVGIDNAPQGFINMLKGDQEGKALLVVSPLDGAEAKVSPRNPKSPRL